MLTQIINGQILTPQGWLKDGSVLISDGKILEVTNSDLAVIGAKVVDAKGMYIIPGFVAMNVHGGGGHDFKECTEEAFHSAIAAHMKHGATTIFPTLSSSPQFMQMGSFKLKNGMRINTYGDYDKDGWRVPNRSAMPWEKNNFRGAFELKSANGNFGIRIEVQQGRNGPY